MNTPGYYLPTDLRPPLRVLLCSPRGFCAGVVRAIDTVERALAVYGPPVYVRHEIVHNKYVVESLRPGRYSSRNSAKSPEGTPVVFCPRRLQGGARRIRQRAFLSIDATCPLVTKVHREAEIHFRRGREIVLIGHHGHPEVIGTLGQLPAGAITLIETLEDAAAFQPRDPSQLAYVTQTTLSVDDTAEIVAVLQQRFTAIVGPHRQDICYATTNRQEAVKRVAPNVDAMIVVGSPNSSNSQRLTEVAKRAGCPYASLVQRAKDVDWASLGSLRTLGITAGASAPELLVEEILDAFAERYSLAVETVSAAEEDMFFPLPRSFRGNEAAE